MKRIHILALVAATVWVLVLVMGVRGIGGVRAQHVLGYPSAWQMRYYIYLPATVAALVVAAWALSISRPPIRAVAIALMAFTLLLLPCFLFFYTGGI